MARGIQLSDVLARSRSVGADVLAREFDLRAEERDMLYQALQLQAQAAVEEIRTAAESRPELSDEDIEEEIQDTRKKS